VVGQSSRSRKRQQPNKRNGDRSNRAAERRRQRQLRDSASRGQGTSPATVRASNVVDFPAPPTISSGSPLQPAPNGFFFFSIWFLRLSILGVGLGAILGTVLAIARPQHVGSLEENSVPSPPVLVATESAPPPALQPTQELARLQQQFTALADARPQLTPGAYFIDPDTGEYLSLRGEDSFAAASTIKVPILVALFQAIDAGQVTLDEKLTMRPDLIATGSGALQYQPPNSQYAVLDLAEKTIISSDNTATNLLLDRLGGAEVLNAKFQDWGLEQTVIRNLLPDLSGTNTTSPQDLVKLMALLEGDRLVKPESRERILAIMRRTKTRTLLPQGLGEGATIAHKTGDIGSMVGDVGAIVLPSGKRYFAAVLVTRPHNDRSAQELIRAYSRAAYQHFASVPPKTGGFVAPAPQ